MEVNHITVLGIGNRLMMDDGIGIYVVEELQKLQGTKGIVYVIGESDIDYSLDVVFNASYTIIVDAVITNKRVGEITLIPFDELLIVNPGISPHNDHLLYTVAKNPDVKGFVIGIEIDPSHITYHYGLCDALEKKFDQITKKVEEIIAQYMG